MVPKQPASSRDNLPRAHTHPHHPMLLAALAVAVGAAIGALARWALALGLNHLFPALPPGTLLANLVGAYLIGVALAFFAQAPQISPEWRLLVITGFLGGLTTFSTFSAEVVGALQQGRLGWAAATVGTHVLGSLALTLAGLATVTLLKR
jgi:fluoride exporter